MEYERWLSLSTDTAVSLELRNMAGDREKITDAFYRSLEFGTGGLRGVLGAGTNRMNIYTVRRASLGLAKYTLENGGQRLVIGYDTRINSRLFAEISASVFAALGIEVYIFSRPLPTPTLSFAVRDLGCFGGVMITASHNPSRYNGYKVYGSDGCQITDTAAASILSCIEASDYFEGDVHEFGELFSKGLIKEVPEKTFDEFIAQVNGRSHLFSEAADKNIRIVYTPLNGTGREPVLRVLSEAGYTSVTVVREQSEHDGNFPTCPYPNPEIPETLALALEYCQKISADILLATDPDSDRLGVAVKDGNGYRILTGNEVGILLFDYIVGMRKKHGTMPDNAIMVKTVVSTDLAERIADKYGVKTVNVLTGFKYIGEKIGELEAMGESDRFIFGFEESCGYLGGDYVRDKDGVFAAYLFSEMTAYYKKNGLTPLGRLYEIYEQFGFCATSLYSYTFEGASGFSKMQGIMASFRDGHSQIGGLSVSTVTDYLLGIDSLPKSNVLKFTLGECASVVVRPSGTEPKIKVYVSVFANSASDAEKITALIKSDCEKLMR